MEYLAVLLPSAAVGAIFYFVMRAIFNADRAERAAEATERAAVSESTSTKESAPTNTEEPDSRQDG